MTITAGHDATILVNERFLNKAVEAMFSASIFPQIKLSPDTDLPLLTNMNLTVVMIDPPLIMVRSSREAEVLFNLGVKPSIDRFKTEAELAGSARFTMGYDTRSKQLIIEVQDIDIHHVELGDFVKVPSFLISPVNRALSFAIKRGLFRQLSRIAISTNIPPIPLPLAMLTKHLEETLEESLPRSGELELTSDLPEKESPRLPLKIAGGGLLRQGMVYGAVNFLDHTGGTLRDITAPDKGSDLQIAVSAPAIGSLVQYIWPYLPQKINRSSRIDVPDYRTMTDSMVGIFDAVRTFGVSRRKVRVDRSWVDFGATIGYGLPELRLKDGGKLEIASCPLSVDAWANPKMEGMADSKTRRKSFVNFLRPGRETTEPQPKPETITMFEFAQHMDLVLQGAIFEIDITPDNMLAGKISNVNLTIDLPWKLPKQVLDGITNWLVNLIVNNFPTMSMGIPYDALPGPFAPLVRSVKIEGIDSNENELIVNASIMPSMTTASTSPSKFIADTNPHTKTVHRLDCNLVREIPERRQMRYYSLYDALVDGFHGCPHCLPRLRSAIPPACKETTLTSPPLTAISSPK